MRHLSLPVPLLWLSICATGASVLGRGGEQAPLIAAGTPAPSSNVAFSPVWDVLGPFEIGTREAPWGADPLERYGGFRALEPDLSAKFPSSLGLDGAVQWSTTDAIQWQAGQSDFRALENENARVTLDLVFPTIDWSFLKLAFGWSALQFQAWARGNITVGAAQSFELYSDGILEFWLDGQLYFGGDFFTFRRAPFIVHLQPGSHRIEVRLLRDVRSMGGVGDPSLVTTLELCKVMSDLSVDSENIVVPDVVDGRPASRVASVPLQNTAKRGIIVTGLKSGNDLWRVSPVHQLPIDIAPGQARPMSLEIIPSNNLSLDIAIQIEYQFQDESHTHSLAVHLKLNVRSRRRPHRFTFLRPGGIVSFSLIRPPPVSPIKSSEARALPVFVYLHGAGVDTNGDRNSHSLDDMSLVPAWTIFASGVTYWSGDDWHQWGWPDVEAAVAAIPTWIEDNQWQGHGARLDKWLVAGHSNGGQGVWYALTHMPDKIFAAVPVSGYLSVQKYIPYTFWRETDPRRMAIVHASTNQYRHELLISNSHGIPIMQQHGTKDDNVPCYHSRRMSQLINESGWQSVYNELPGRGHWFPGVMTTDPLLQFYNISLQPKLEDQAKESKFTLVAANPADTGPKYGIHVRQLIDPGQLGRIEARVQQTDISLETSNVESFALLNQSIHEYKSILIDGQETSLAEAPQESETVFVLEANASWRIASSSDLATVHRRSGAQLGHLDAILRTRDCFVVLNCHKDTTGLALQIARNMYQYFAADTQIVESAKVHEVKRLDGNFITVGIGADISPSEHPSHPIRLSASSLRIRDYTGREKEFTAGEEGLAAIFLRPLEKERLELVVWGTDRVSVGNAARLVPLMTGAGQPDFIVLSSESSWKGIDGALALGFFDTSWNVTRSSFML